MASAAAVSTATASRALSRPELVSESARLRVIGVASRLGYAGNPAARALATRRSGWIGVVISQQQSIVMAPALPAFVVRLARDGWSVRMTMSSDMEAAVSDAGEALVRQGAEALAFFGLDVPAAPDPASAAVPGISAWGAIDSTGTGFDPARAAHLAVDYLATLGHRRLALVGASRSLFDRALEEGMRAASAATASTLVVLEMATISPVQIIASWRDQADAPTAIVCGSDALALTVLHECCRAGIDIPGRFSLVGMGDTSLGRVVSPGLTSVRIPALGVGEAAAVKVMDRLANATLRREDLPLKIAIRGSTGQAPVRDADLAC